LPVQPRRVFRFAYRSEDKKATATACTVLVLRSHSGMIFPVTALLSGCTDNVSESRIRWRTASGVIAGGRLRCTG
jgi:hypothetical protein